MSHRTIRRLAGFTYMGFHRYFLTWCTRARARVFTDAATVDLVITQVLRTADEERFAILVYCAMPDHLHLVAAGTGPDADALRFVKRAKQRSGWAYVRNTGERLWQRRYFERIVRDEESARAYVRYVLDNPVRAGLVNSPGEYPFIGSSIWTREDLLESASL